MDLKIIPVVVLAMIGSKAYYSNAKPDNESRLVEQYAPLVKKIALHLKARLPHSVQLDDLIQSGMIGLLDATKNFEQGKGASFETFASIRIRGAMIDEIRRGDWAPRSVHHNSRLINDAMVELAKLKHRDPTDEEVAEYLKVSISEYHTMLYESATSKVTAIEDLGVSSDALVFDNQDISEDAPLSSLMEEKYKDALAKAIESLPQREAMVFSLYYNEELNLKEIGLVLEVSESRVSQILNQALMRLRTKLKDWR